MSAGLRIDLWLWRARLTKSRARAADLVAAGNVRLIRQGTTRRLEKPSAEIAPGDTIVLPGRAGLRAVKVLAVPSRRGPPAEAACHYAELDDIDGLA